MYNGGSISQELGLMLVIKFGRDFLVQFTLRVRKLRSKGAKHFPCDQSDCSTRQTDCSAPD